MYDQDGYDPVLLEAFREAADKFYLGIGTDGTYVMVDEVERQLHSGKHLHYKPECVDRHYYRTLQKACEGAVKTLRRRGEID